MFLLNLLLALAWVGLTGAFTPTNFLIGFGLAYGLLWLMQRAGGEEMARQSGYFGRAWRTVEFAAFFLWELILANLRVAVDILRPRMRLQPAVVAIPLEESSPAQITLLANLITLTPGTLSLDVSSDRRVLYVHTMHVGDVERFRRTIKEQFERRVREVLP